LVLAIPTSWQPLPAIADAMRAAIRDPAIAVDTSAAWGEPARGCYAIALTLHGGDAAIDAVADQLLVSLGAATATEIRRPPAGAAGGTLALTFTRPPYRGQLRVELARARGSTSAEAVACFANDREPDRCARTCRALLGAAR
jgi:predicted lipid-binding transport protein (Tim44 family)